MLTKNIDKFAREKWICEEYYNTITKISDTGNGNSLVMSPQKMFWFDHISSDLYTCKNNMPTSVDGIIITEHVIYFVEFKTGFKKKITTKNFDIEKATCSYKGDICRDYWDLFSKTQKKETEQLIDSIRDKAIESYITLEKKLAPHFIDLDETQKYRLVFIAVIDENEIDNMEATLGDLCSKDSISNNCFSDIRKSLQRCLNQRDVCGHDYYYDEIKVMSSSDFISFINQTYIIQYN